MTEPVPVTQGHSPRAAAVARQALAQLQGDLGSATLAIEEAHGSGQMTPNDLTHLAVAHRAIVRALNHVAAVRDAHGWPNPDQDATPAAQPPEQPHQEAQR